LIEGADQAQATNWWLWCGHLEAGDEREFVYAILAPTYNQPFENSRSAHPVADGFTLVVHETVVGSELGTQMRDAADRGMLDFPAMGIPLPATAVSSRRSTIDDVLGHGAAHLDAHYTFARFGLLRAAPPGALRTLLRLLEEELGLPFAGRLIGHLGNLDVVDFNGDPPDSPVSVATLSVRCGLVVEFRRKRHWVDQAMLAHLRTTSGGEVLSDELVPLPVGDGRIKHVIPSATVGLEVSIFGASGGPLRHHEETSLLGGIHLNIDLQGRTVQLDDPLTKRMQGAGKATAGEASERTEFYRSRSAMAAVDRRIDSHAAVLRARLAAEASKSRDRFFKRTLASEWGAVAHIRSLLDDAETESAILVDPFFGNEALLRLLTRLRRSGLDLTVITAWATTDPDTAREIPAGKSDALNENIERLRLLADQLTGLLTPKLRLLNLVRGRDPAFHDRYLLLRRTGENEPVIYLLSNSINGLAVNWPFCMGALDGAAARQVADYVEGLARGEDVASDGAVEANFDWRSDDS
jgi:hypothetical protein